LDSLFAGDYGMTSEESHAKPAGAGPLGATVAEAVDRVCDQFEAAWRSGARPDLAAYLADVGGPECAVLARELIAVDVHWRVRAGETPRADDYVALLARVPGDYRDWLALAESSPSAVQFGKQNPPNRPAAPTVRGEPQGAAVAGSSASDERFAPPLAATVAGEMSNEAVADYTTTVSGHSLPEIPPQSDRPAAADARQSQCRGIRPRQPDSVSRMRGRRSPAFPVARRAP
jgi:hypothetical protein